MSLRNIALLLVALSMILAFSACGGGSEGGSQGGGGGDGGSGNGGAGGGGERTQPETQTVEGRVAKSGAQEEITRFVLVPEEGDRLVFVVRENSEITLDGEAAAPEDLEKGQLATVEYVPRQNQEDPDKTRNVVRSLELTSPRGGRTGAEETTGG